MKKIARLLCWIEGHLWTDPLSVAALPGGNGQVTFHSHCERCLAQVNGTYLNLRARGAFKE
jgi:hypothetical protein